MKIRLAEGWVAAIENQEGRGRGGTGRSPEGSNKKRKIRKPR